MNLIPTKIVRPKPYLLYAEWSDGFSGTIKLETLRDNCPCAECRGEEAPSIDGNRRISMSAFKTLTPGRNELKELNPIGNYGLQPIWGDDHDAGLYTWEILRQIFETNKLSEESIQKLEEKYNKK
ncbi:MAG TPA: DUF971 domain-containing protein [Candidatus Kapabacteria bacterium]|mgnify:FL=1|nr:DUF971 domain-containing protein [Candidatus Kapabacteria bacterium]HRT67788.1 DUF971 domain-containing protein [Bacteroidota bacterium]